MNNTNSKNLINEMRQLLNPTKKLTLEGLVYGEDGEEMMGNDAMPPQEGGMGEPTGEPGMAPEQNGMAPQGNPMEQGQVEENPLDGDPEITKLITNIRVQTLQGLTKLAQHPETAQYELLKKIFLLVDKSVEDKLDPEK